VFERGLEIAARQAQQRLEELQQALRRGSFLVQTGSDSAERRFVSGFYIPLASAIKNMFNENVTLHC
jgi:hypothetical protein